MKTIFLLITTIILSKSAPCQDSILIRFESTFDRNAKIRFNNCENVDSVLTEIRTNKNKKIYRTSFYLSESDLVYNNSLRLYLFVKRRFWFGWNKFYVMDVYQKGVPLFIFESMERKRRFRYTHVWTNKKPYD